MIRNEPEHAPGDRFFYVTIRRGSRSGFLLGPYHLHSEARENVDRARRMATDRDPFAAFDAFGTAQAKHRRTVFGR